MSSLHAAFQLILSSRGYGDHLRGHQDHVLIFFVIFNSTLICHLSGQEAFFVWSLTRDPSLIWNTLHVRYQKFFSEKSNSMILVEKITVKLCFTNTSPIWTPHYYRQFALSLGKERPYIFSKLNLFLKYRHPVSTDTLYGPSDVHINAVWLYLRLNGKKSKSGS